MILQVWKALKLGKLLHGLNVAGMAGRSVWSVNQAYTGVRNTLNKTDGYRTQYLNPKERYDITVMIEGIEMEVKEHKTSFDLLDAIKAISQVPGMQIMISKSTAPRWKKWVHRGDSCKPNEDKH